MRSTTSSACAAASEHLAWPFPLRGSTAAEEANQNQRQSLRNASLFPQSWTLARRRGRGSDGFATKCLDRSVHGGEQRRITEVFAESDRYEHLAQGAVGASELQGDTPGAKLFGEPR